MCDSSPLQGETFDVPIVIIPVQDWGKVARRALQFALTLSADIRAVHVVAEDETSTLGQQWKQVVDAPLKKAGLKPPELVVLPSPYRLVLRPVLDYVHKIERDYPNRQIAVIVPELVEKHWYHYPLHNQRAELLKALLLKEGCERIILINVPWYLRA